MTRQLRLSLALRKNVGGWRRPIGKLVLISAALLSLCLLSTVGYASDRWYVEFREAGLAESQVRRAVALELRELSIPGDPKRADDDAEQVSLYIRVGRDGQYLTVSLWDRGEFVGTRRVSDNAHSTILARRVGLAVGELGSRLAHKRVRAGRRMEREAGLLAQRKEREEEQRRQRALAFRSGVTTMIVPKGAWSVGPSMGFSFNDKAPLSFSSDLSWGAGGLPGFTAGGVSAEAPYWSQFELLLGADYLIRTSAFTTISLGGIVGASAVHVGGGAHVDQIVGQKDTWSARAGLRLGSSRRFSEDFSLRLDLSAGALLRPVPIQWDDQELRLGGAFLGLSVTALLLPSFN
jgi:hypothetical protein